ncbi:MAG TPA: MmcQ/YjbR family DNA-binding protein [Planctomycetota bacterium]|nr:MmcQ/YjbR family DNA-binding protein [Planctomycetota bacterium]
MNQKMNEARESLIAHALAFPGAFEDNPWGERVAKVGKKVFVFFGVSTPDEPRLMVVVKLPQSSVAALDQAFAEPAGYGLGKSGWVAMVFQPGDKPPMDLLKAWILESYRAVAPKTLLKQQSGAPVKPAAKKTVAKKAVAKKAKKKTKKSARA